MEFIQFHPSAICTDSEEAFLISEAVRGEGAHLINQNGERFMPAIHELAELAPRDIVAQSIYSQMRKYNQDFVWLSLKHLNPETVKKRFPNIYEKCRELGIDMCDRIPVAPGSPLHGRRRQDRLKRTNQYQTAVYLRRIGIFRYYGANRLASNSLIECLVFGKRAIEASRQNRGSETSPDSLPDSTATNIMPRFIFNSKKI